MSHSERPITFQKFDTTHSRVSVRNDYPPGSINKEVPVINEKTVSYELLLNVIGRRFHTCLKRESEAQPRLADTLSDAELVHSICRRERLTFYNFLKEHKTD